MTKYEALKLALEDLLEEYDMVNSSFAKHMDDIFKQALAAPDLQAELDATNRQVEILCDALAKSRREIDALVALARADEREAVEDLLQEYDMVDSAFARDFRARSCPPCNEDCDQGRNCPARKDK